MFLQNWIKMSQELWSSRPRFYTEWNDSRKLWMFQSTYNAFLYFLFYNYSFPRKLIRTHTDEFDDLRRANLIAINARLGDEQELDLMDLDTFELQYNAACQLIAVQRFGEAQKLLEKASGESNLLSWISAQKPQKFSGMPTHIGRRWIE